jgi:4-hydroxy-tetrahydrodipicolinate reductase
VEAVVSDPVKIVILGAGGRMGQEIIEAVRKDDGVLVHGVVELPGHPIIGHPPTPDLPLIEVVSDLKAALIGADVLVDFTRPESTLGALEIAAEAGVAAVVGTTGLSSEERFKLAGFAEEIPLVFSPNMSVGINVMMWLLRIATEALGQDYDVEVFEMHHRHKKDSPSGTALRLAEVLCEARGVDMNDTLSFGRKGLAPRTDTEIGMQVLRGGDVAGEHTVYFLGEGERLEVTHRASSRHVFAQGALRAASWVRGRRPGLYSMDEVLGL